MKKEVLTPDRCREDVLQMLGYKQRLNLFVGVLLAVLIAILIGSVILMEGDSLAKLILSIAVCVILLPVALIDLIPSIRNARLLKKIRQTGCDIYEDVLTVALTERMRGSRGYRTINYYYLRFENCGEYLIPPHPHYQWSGRFEMLTREVHDTAESGDGFYVVCLKDQGPGEPLMVYNQKFFVLCEDGTTHAPHTSWRDSVNVE
jgi:hypothetical protein